LIQQRNTKNEDSPPKSIFTEPEDYGMRGPSLFSEKVPGFDITFGYLIEFFHKICIVNLKFLFFLLLFKPYHPFSLFRISQILFGRTTFSRSMEKGTSLHFG